MSRFHVHSVSVCVALGDEVTHLQTAIDRIYDILHDHTEAIVGLQIDTDEANTHRGHAIVEIVPISKDTSSASASVERAWTHMMKVESQELTS